jgi:hypothetical protein
MTDQTPPATGHTSMSDATTAAARIPFSKTAFSAVPALRALLVVAVIATGALSACAPATPPPADSAPSCPQFGRLAREKTGSQAAVDVILPAPIRQLDRLRDDREAWSNGTVYVWWMCLKLVVLPVCNAYTSAGPSASADISEEPQQHP